MSPVFIHCLFSFQEAFYVSHANGMEWNKLMGTIKTIVLLAACVCVHLCVAYTCEHLSQVAWPQQRCNSIPFLKQKRNFYTHHTHFVRCYLFLIRKWNGITCCGGRAHCDECSYNTTVLIVRFQSIKFHSCKIYVECYHCFSFTF